MRTALFMPCFNDVFFPRTGMATVKILETLGHTVHFPSEQTCCGQIHFNTGYREEAFHQLQRFLRWFGGSETIVAPSASCVAMVREHYPVLAKELGHAGLESEVRALGGRTFELTQYLVEELGVEDVGAWFPARVALHPTCHSIRGIDVGEAPERLLRAVNGLELVPLPDARECCGFGGTFAVKNFHTSLAMLSDKIDGVLRSGAGVLTAVDNSCLMHLAGGMRRRGRLEEDGAGGSNGRRIRVMHIAEILASGKDGLD
jgi:L-lactate dehydrogenase complex protein LldE